MFSKLSTLSSMVDGSGEPNDISPIEANFKSSFSFKPFAGPRLQRSVPCLANASLNFLICQNQTQSNQNLKMPKTPDKEIIWIYLNENTHSCICAAKAT